MYIEGVRDGRRFFDSVRHAAERHPVVIWKGGMTEAGARATFSHTGSLATPEAMWRAMVRQSGAVEVASLDAMLDAVELFARAKRLGGQADGPGCDDRRAIGGNHRHVRRGGAGDSRAVGVLVRRAQDASST